MSNYEHIYLNLLKDVMENGVDRPDRTGVGVRSIFGKMVKYDISINFPLLTTKKMNLKSVLSELLWFIEGSGDERRLAEIRWGKSRDELADKKTIWTANAEAPIWKPKARYEGDLGRIYGTQWRKWTSATLDEVDQLTNLIDGLRNDPFGRRHILTAWNPGELDMMALPPCHILSQFYVDGDKLSCLLYQRSADVGIGVPYNIASYALLTHMIAKVCGYVPHELVHTMGDTHIYHNHFSSIEKQLSLTPKKPPLLYIAQGIKNIDDFKMEHFDLIGYESHPPINMPMAV